MRNRQDGYEELLANIRRLTVMVLDSLEAGSKDRTLDQGQKRLLSSTGARLLRLWRATLREGGSQRVAENLVVVSKDCYLSPETSSRKV